MTLGKSSHSTYAFLIAVVALIFLFAEREYSSVYWVIVQVFGGVALLVYLWMLYQKRRAVLFTSFYQVFYWLGILASALVISTGAYMIEIEQTGTTNGTFWLALIFFVAGMEMTVIGYICAARPIPGLAVARFSAGIQKFLIFAAVGVTLVVSAYVFIQHRGPILAGEDRVTFWSQFSFPLSMAPSFITQAFFFAAYYYLWQARRNERALLATLIVVGFILIGYFILGEKFSLYILYINTWLFLLAGLLPNFTIRGRAVLVAGAVCLGLFSVVGITYLRDGYGLGFILTRGALQAQLLWSVVEDGSAFRISPQNVACFFGCEDFWNGRDYISHRYLPPPLYEHYANMGNVLSGFNPALPLLTFGLAATGAIYLLASFILGWLQRKTVNAFSQENMIYGLLLFKIHFGCTILVATGSLEPLRGLVITAFGVMAYHVIFPRRGPAPPLEQRTGG